MKMVAMSHFCRQNVSQISLQIVANCSHPSEILALGCFFAVYIYMVLCYIYHVYDRKKKSAYFKNCKPNRTTFISANFKKQSQLLSIFINHSVIAVINNSPSGGRSHEKFYKKPSRQKIFMILDLILPRRPAQSDALITSVIQTFGCLSIVYVKMVEHSLRCVR